MNVQAYRAIASTCMLMFLTSLDVTIVNVALPAVQRGLAVPAVSLAWLVEGYSIPFATLMLSGGVVADRIGRSRTFAYGIAFFGLGSFFCTVAPSFGILVLARVIQGVGAAICTPAALAVLRCSVPRQQLGRAVAYWVFSGSVAVSAGPLLGGILVQALGWRSIFLINIPIVIIAVCLAFPQAWKERRDLDAPVNAADVLGQMLYAISATILVGGLVLFQDHVHRNSWTTPIMFLLSATCGFTLFYIRERRANNPVLPSFLLRTRAFQSAAIIGASVNAVNYGLLYCLGLYYGGAHEFTALHSGLLFLPLMVAIGISTMAVEPVRRALGDQTTVISGLILELSGALLISIRADSAGWISMSSMLMGFGVGLVIPPITTRLLSAVGTEISGVASGAFSSMRQLGSAVGVAVFGLAIHSSPSSVRVDICAVSVAGACVLVASLVTYLAAAESDTTSRVA